MATKIVKRQTGSQVVKCLENLSAAITKRHPELPEVVIVTGAGLPHGKWAHYSIGYHWYDRTASDNGDQAPEGEKTAPAKRPEMFIAGERLACGAEDTLQSMMHEYAHALADVRGIQDCSRQGRYHNGEFLKCAEELGLSYPYTNDKGKPSPNSKIGFSAVELTEETKVLYKAEIEKLDAAIKTMIDNPLIPLLTGKGADGQDGDSGNDGHRIGRKLRTPGTPSRNNVKYVCDCDKPRVMRMAPSVFEIAPITCGSCGHDFHEDV
jgi:hypothetical protein